MWAPWSCRANYSSSLEDTTLINGTAASHRFHTNEKDGVLLTVSCTATTRECPSLGGQGRVGCTLEHEASVSGWFLRAAGEGLLGFLPSSLSKSSVARHLTSSSLSSLYRELNSDSLNRMVPSGRQTWKRSVRNIPQWAHDGAGREGHRGAWLKGCAPLLAVLLPLPHSPSLKARGNVTVRVLVRPTGVTYTKSHTPCLPYRKCPLT